MHFTEAPFPILEQLPEAFLDIPGIDLGTNWEKIIDLNPGDYIEIKAQAPDSLMQYYQKGYLFYFQSNDSEIPPYMTMVTGEKFYHDVLLSDIKKIEKIRSGIHEPNKFKPMDQVAIKNISFNQFEIAHVGMQIKKRIFAFCPLLIEEECIDGERLLDITEAEESDTISLVNLTRNEALAFIKEINETLPPHYLGFHNYE